MKKKIYLAFGFFLSLAWSESAQAQQKIGSNPGTLHPGAILELESSNRGFLLPRISIANLSTWGLNGTATDGMMVYNTNATTGTGYYVWSGSAWTRIFTGTLNTATTNVLDYNTTSRILTSTVNGVAASSAALPLATSSETGLLSNTDWSTFNAKENALTFANGLTRTTNAIALGGALTGSTSLTLGANSFTFGGATTGKVIVSGPAGSSTSGLQLSNLLTAVTPATATASQRVLTVDGSGNVILGTDFGSNNAGTVTNVTGTAPINVSSGNTTPVISINALGITSDLIADGAITGAKLAAGAISAANLADGAITSAKILDGTIASADLADAAVTTAKITPGTNGQFLTTAGGVATWASLPVATVTGAANGLSLVSGNVELGGSLSKVTTISQGTNALTFDGTGNLVKLGGNLGIGTSSPLHRLHVDDGKLAVGSTSPGTWTTNGSDILLNTGTANSQIILRPNGDGSASNQFVTQPSAGHLFFGSDGLEKVRIAHDGNMGIGTSSPGAKLAVNGTSHLFGLVSTGGSIELGGLGSGDRSTYIDFHGQDGVDYNARIIRDPGANGVFNIINGSSLLTLNTTGNVGIGTTSPSAKLEVAGQVKITGGAPGAGKVLTSDADGLASWVTPSTSNLAIRRVTAATTVTSTDHTIIANAFDAGYTITLPAPSASTGQILVIRKVDESSNAITFTFAGITATNAIRVSDTSASAGAYMNTLNYNRTIRIQSDGTDWYLLD